MKKLIAMTLLLSAGSLYAAGGTTATASASLYVQETTGLTISGALTFSPMTARSTIGSNVKSSNGPITVTSIVANSTTNGQNVTLAWGANTTVGVSAIPYAALQGTQTPSNYIPFNWFYGPTTASTNITGATTKIISSTHPVDDTVTCVLDAVLLIGQSVGPTDYYVHNATLTSNSGA